MRPWRGSVLLYAVVFGVLGFSIVVIAVSGYAIFENHASIYKHNREQSFQIAEAGINYYRWHLAHDKFDYQDGTATSGPYIHDYTDKDGNVIGHFSLNVTPPATTNTIVIVESTGWLDSQPDSLRKIRVRLGFPSLTDYSFLTANDVWIGNTEFTHGKFHANGGIRYDGTADAAVTSAQETYICKEHQGCGWTLKPGIWGDGGPTEFWDFPVPAKDFTIITVKLEEIETLADENGLLLSASGNQGWRLRFNADGTISVDEVLTTKCYKGADIGEIGYSFYCIDPNTFGSTTIYPAPANGYIFVNDNIWVEGVVNGRVTIGTSVDHDIILNNDITYLVKDGNHVLGLISERDILVPHDSPDDLEVDAALLAQHGACKRYYYPSDKKDSIYIYGSVITYGVWTWSWTSGGSQVVSGYVTTNSTYDANLTYSPPGGFPVGSSYNLVDWEEIEEAR